MSSRTKKMKGRNSAARKARTKIRKPKFLSLRLELSASENNQQTAQTPEGSTDQKQLDLFPLHPEISLLQDHENMEYYFSSADGGATSLMGLLNASSTSREEEDNQPADLPAYGAASSLVRSALRNKERDTSEEKWVCISEVVEQKEEEVTSSAAVPVWQQSGGGRSGCSGVDDGSGGGLSLKLDYEEVLNAWSDKGPLYIEEESPQTVPDLHDDFLYNWGQRSGGGSSSLWTVPESSWGKMGDEKAAGKEGRQLGQREASVLRYKEKRQSRLFAKRIRYEVRRLNAEKRPRIKGRFVKRN